MKNKYGIVKNCKYCKNEFTTRPRLLEYCSQACKNPNNRIGNIPWNKGITLTEDQKAKQNRDGLTKGWGWNKGIPNERQREKWLKDNPNKDGKVNNLSKINKNTVVGSVKNLHHTHIKEIYNVFQLHQSRFIQRIFYTRFLH